MQKTEILAYRKFFFIESILTNRIRWLRRFHNFCRTHLLTMITRELLQALQLNFRFFLAHFIFELFNKSALSQFGRTKWKKHNVRKFVFIPLLLLPIALNIISCDILPSLIIHEVIVAKILHVKHFHLLWQRLES